MKHLNYINTVINQQIEQGIYDVVINLDDYTTDDLGVTEVIELPALLENINFISSIPDKEYGFRIVARELRTNDLTVTLNNVNINSDKLIGIDLRGVSSPVPVYKNTISFQGINKVVSNENIGILVTNGQTIEITGKDSASVLSVKGGIRNAAIGNNQVINFGGHLIFSGDGTINAIGGNGALPNEPGLSTAIDGAQGIGFIQNTIGKSSIIIKCNIEVNAKGGTGQNCDTGNVNSRTAGNGGAGISVGAEGILLIEKCSNTLISLNAEGGEGGLINDTSPGGSMTDMRTGGNGGDAVTVVSGTVNILGNAVLTGGNGTSLGVDNANLPVFGGDGGNALAFTGSTGISNVLIIGDNVKAVGGNGGNSGNTVNIDTFSIESSKGGSGGDVINLGHDPSNVSIGSSKLTSGSGGTGGSPKAYVDSGELDIDTLREFQGVDLPANGGSNGSNIIGYGITNMTISPKIQMNQGMTGDGGVGIDNNGEEIKGLPGVSVKSIDVLSKSTPHFGYINLSGVMNFTLYNSDLSYAKKVVDTSSKNIPIKINNLNIMHIFESSINIENVIIQSKYDISKPDLLIGSANMDLIVNSYVAAYVKSGIPIISQM